MYTLKYNIVHHYMNSGNVKYHPNPEIETYDTYDEANERREQLKRWNRHQHKPSENDITVKMYRSNISIDHENWID